MLQRYGTGGGLADAVTFDSKEGLPWRIGDRTRVETDLKDWMGKRAQAGRKAPRGFPKNNRFSK
jgi:topoisomerase-4 subunit A